MRTWEMSRKGNAISRPPSGDAGGGTQWTQRGTWWGRLGCGLELRPHLRADVPPIAHVGFDSVVAVESQAAAAPKPADQAALVACLLAKPRRGDARLAQEGVNFFEKCVFGAHGLHHSANRYMLQDTSQNLHSVWKSTIC